MSPSRPPRIGLALAFLALFLGAAPAKGPVVLAAASLQGVMDDLADGWAAKGHARPILSYAGTQVLARQAERGAPADLLVAADRQWIDWLAARGIADAKAGRMLARGRLVIVAPKTREIGWIASRDALVRALGNGRLAVADPENVPAGRYARAALTRLGLWPALSDRLAVAENVRATLAFAERGSVPLAIVYETDARASERVRIVGRFAAGAHAPIEYVAVPLRQAGHLDTRAFLAYLCSVEARRLFRRAGFATSESGC